MPKTPRATTPTPSKNAAKTPPKAIAQAPEPAPAQAPVAAETKPSAVQYTPREVLPTLTVGHVKTEQFATGHALKLARLSVELGCNRTTLWRVMNGLVQPKLQLQKVIARVSKGAITVPMWSQPADPADPKPVQPRPGERRIAPAPAPLAAQEADGDEDDDAEDGEEDESDEDEHEEGAAPP